MSDTATLPDRISEILNKGDLDGERLSLKGVPKGVTHIHYMYLDHHFSRYAGTLNQDGNSLPFYRAIRCYSQKDLELELVTLALLKTAERGREVTINGQLRHLEGEIKVAPYVFYVNDISF